ncbi:MAG: efflux RND transporter periplasmic adaptor subunit [Pseudomonadota bacterium]
MSAGKSLYSPSWYRVEKLRPRIQPGVVLQRQIARMEEWFLITHPVTGRHYRLNRKSYEFIARLNGEMTIDALWNGLLQQLGDEAPTQDETLGILTQLTEAGLILFDVLPDLPSLRKTEEARHSQEQNTALNPFAFKIRLFDPSDFLNRLHFLRRILFQPLTLILWSALIGWGCLRAALDWDAIRSYAAVHLLTPRYLLLGWFVYPCMKALHELGHALAVRHWGGEVKETGFNFFLLMPAPYVDASAATAFPSKWQRIAVGGAGIAVELALSSLALLLWVSVEAGMLRDIAFVVMAIGGLSTVIFNANPLMRFDGYYMTCDLLELPNLASRSQRLWSSFFQRYILGMQSAPFLPVRGERIWLLCYGPASWIYRLSLSLVILQWIATKSVVLGLLAILWMAFLLFLRPLWKGLCALTSPNHPSERRWRPFLGAGVAAVCLLAAFIWVPVPSSTVAAGLVWMPEQSQVRSKTIGQVIEILARDGQEVTKGEALILMHEPSLATDYKRLIAKINGQEAEQLGNLLTASARSRNAAYQLERLHHDIAESSNRLDELTLRAEVDGVFVLPRGDDLLGRYVQKGTMLGYVIGHDDMTVRAVVSQDDEGRIKAGVKAVSVQLAEDRRQPFHATLVREVPAATHQLPSAALGDRAGGPFVTDPTDQDGVKTLEPVFLVDVTLPQQKVERLGGRAWIRFEHEAMPLADTVGWQFRQLFLKFFGAES